MKKTNRINTIWKILVSLATQQYIGNTCIDLQLGSDASFILRQTAVTGELKASYCYYYLLFLPQRLACLPSLLRDTPLQRTVMETMVARCLSGCRDRGGKSSSRERKVRMLRYARCSRATPGLSLFCWQTRCIIRGKVGSELCKATPSALHTISSGCSAKRHLTKKKKKEKVAFWKSHRFFSPQSFSEKSFA